MRSCNECTKTSNRGRAAHLPAALLSIGFFLPWSEIVDSSGYQVAWPTASRRCESEHSRDASELHSVMVILRSSWKSICGRPLWESRTPCTRSDM